MLNGSNGDAGKELFWKETDLQWFWLYFSLCWTENPKCWRVKMYQIFLTVSSC